MRFLILMALIFQASCIKPDLAEQLAEDQEKTLEGLREDINLMAENLRACQADHECSVVGIDPMPCGGMANFLIVSENSSRDGEYDPISPTKDYLFLINRVESYNIRLRDANQGMVGACVWNEPPAASCDLETKTCN